MMDRGLGMALSKDGKGDVKENEQGLDDLTRLEIVLILATNHKSPSGCSKVSLLRLDRPTTTKDYCCTHYCMCGRWSSLRQQDSLADYAGLLWMTRLRHDGRLFAFTFFFFLLVLWRVNGVKGAFQPCHHWRACVDSVFYLHSFAVLWLGDDER